MNIILTLYPFLLFVLCIFYGTLYMFPNINYRWIITFLDYYVHATHKDEIKKIKKNIRETFIVRGNLTNTKQAIYVVDSHDVYMLHMNTDCTDWPYKVKQIQNTDMKKALQAGDSVCIETSKELFHIAIETGVPIIPVISDGDCFTQINTLGFFEYITNKTGIKMKCPSYSSIKEWVNMRAKKVYTHIGNSIDVGKARTPTSKEIEELQDRYHMACKELHK